MCGNVEILNSRKEWRANDDITVERAGLVSTHMMKDEDSQTFVQVSVHMAR